MHNKTVDETDEGRQRANSRYATIAAWGGISGLSRSAIYLHLSSGHLRAKKVGKRVLVDVEHGLAWLASLPDAKFRAPATAKPDAPCEGMTP